MASPRCAAHVVELASPRESVDLCYIFLSLPGMTRDDPAAFVPPPAFGPFRVLHQIGIGALGPVFRTYEPARDRLVAVKVFRLDVTPEQARTLADELSLAADAGLFHPSIVEPIAAGVEGTVAYRAEEYVAAESLDVAIRHYAPATLDKALPFLTQLAGAIDFARTSGVGHGGLHLRDVFVTPDEARASGFGIVEALERTGLRAPVRRPYSAPERIAGAAWSTPADVFSLAAIAYELLTGRRPSGTGEQIAPLTGTELGPHADVIRSVLARAMDDDPARRYQTALGFASALEVAAHSGAVTEGDMGIAGGAIPVMPLPAVPRSPAQIQVHSASPGDLTPDPSDRPIASTATNRAISQDAAADVEPPHDDIAIERDEDAAHHVLLREMDEAAAPTLFDNAGDDDERLADLAMAGEEVVANDSAWEYEEPASVTPVAQHAEDFDAPRQMPRRGSTLLGDDQYSPESAERARVPLLPIALGVLVGLLIGFALGYAVAGRYGAAQTNAAAAAAPRGEASPPAASTSAAPPPSSSGRAYSEQTVTPPRTAPAPTGDVPPVPGEEPSRAAAAPAPARPAPTRPTTGRLVIRSTPSGAGVTLNGRWRGRTPLTLDAVPFGPYVVRLAQPGYTSVPEDVRLSESDPARTVSIVMKRERAAAAPPSRTPARPNAGRAAVTASPRKPAVTRSPFAGTIYVDSNPRGARVLIDGRSMGTTPASIPDVAIGSHVVRLELADHRTWTTATRVTAGEQTRVTGSLERIR
jgi:serine/threonine protein kinase